MQRKKLEDLNLIDDFLFCKMLQNEEIGEEFARYLLEIIFDRKFGSLKVVPQRVYYGQDTDKRGIRMDVYMEEEVDSETLLKESGIYDIEVEKTDAKSERAVLPKRVRFYHSTIDVNSLGSGADFNKLKKAIVVMIMPFDPFEYDQMVYTIQNTCLEVPELPYDDGAKTMFLYTKGKKGNPTDRLKELLHYMEDTREQNAKSEELKAIHDLVKVVKQDPEVSESYMKWFEIERSLIAKGHVEGRAEGHAAGRAEELVRLCREFRQSEEDILARLMKDLNLSKDEALQYMKEK